MFAATEPDYRDESYLARCAICGESGDFKRTSKFTRETFSCRHCRGSLRYQAQAYAITKLFGGPIPLSLRELVESGQLDDLTVYEPGIIGPFREIFADHQQYHKSFYWSDVAAGSERDGIQCQNLECLTYEDESFDLIITSDIFEHIRRPFVAFQEILRVLKPGGAHVFSIPASHDMPAKTTPRVDTTGEHDIQLLPEVFHGTGISGMRSLVYNDFGTDILDKLKEIGLETAISHFTPAGAEDVLNPQVSFVSVKARK